MIVVLITTFIVVSLLTACVVNDSNSVVTTTLETTTTQVDETTTEVSTTELLDVVESDTTTMVHTITRKSEKTESSEVSTKKLKPTTTTLNTVLTTTKVSKSLKYKLSAEDRRIVEKIVMGEAGGESFKGQMLVAQCILNACVMDGLTPAEVRNVYQYSGWNEYPTESVCQAVYAVFDEGVVVTEEPILYFYAYTWCNSPWHETQRYVLTEGGHRFFAKWS